MGHLASLRQRHHGRTAEADLKGLAAGRRPEHPGLCGPSDPQLQAAAVAVYALAGLGDLDRGELVEFHSPIMPRARQGVNNLAGFSGYRRPQKRINGQIDVASL